jgi:undecaprenyl-diphosphatase
LAFSSPRWTSGEFIVTGLILILTIWAIDKGKKLNIVNTIIIGIAQAISIMPAISRSGSTIAAGMFCGVNKEKAAEYSFLLSIPAIGGAAILEIPEMLKLLPTASILWTYLIGTVASGVVGYFSISFLLSVIKKGKFSYFGLYCILIGILGLLFL